MTGTVQKVHVAIGDTVSTGDPLVVLEAMKMEHVLRAPRNGVIDTVNCGDGEQVEAQAVLVSLAEDDGDTGAVEVDSSEAESAT